MRCVIEACSGCKALLALHRVTDADLRTKDRVICLACRAVTVPGTGMRSSSTPNQMEHLVVGIPDDYRLSPIAVLDIIQWARRGMK